ncbi:hypothetical protein [Agaribacter flavus]|uniref:Uncharacterized protein n=1 Tax=Agaribacter flavus TaxID=1902781 RepID=A0ABV7FME3_9ALTE
MIRLAKGEKAMPGAPIINISKNQPHLPQHYITYEHDVDSVRTLLSKITFDDDVLLFSAIDHQGLYIQVGIIGHENYRNPNIDYPPKIVYGRKWRIDSDTPTAEIIQTTMLAIKKVMEHEVREYLTLKIENHKVRSTPLSSHQDVGMLQKAAKYAVGLVKKSPIVNPEKELTQQLKNIQFANHNLEIEKVIPLPDGRAVIDIKFIEQKLLRSEKSCQHRSTLPLAYCDKRLSVIIYLNEIDGLMYSLIDELVALSDRYVEEHFAFEGFHRFSRKYSPTWLAQQSIKSRPYKQHMQDRSFKHTFETLNFETDKQRKPAIGRGTLADVNRKKLSKIEGLTGHLPDDVEPIILRRA